MTFSATPYTNTEPTPKAIHQLLMTLTEEVAHEGVDILCGEI